MKLIACIFLLTFDLYAAVNWTYGFIHGENAGPQTVARGYSYIYQIIPHLALKFNCVSNVCTSDSGYIPNGTEQFYVFDTLTTATGLQSAIYAGESLAPDSTKYTLNMNSGTPLYRPININGTTGAFNLAQFNNVFNIAETAPVATPGTFSPTNISSTNCPDGDYPGPPNSYATNGVPGLPAGGSNQGIIMDCPGGGSPWSGCAGKIPAYFKFTLTSGNISNLQLITGGGNYTTAPTHGTLVCSTDRNNPNSSTTQKVDVTFTGGTLGNGIVPIGDGLLVAILYAGGTGAPGLSPRIYDVRGTDWPGPTTSAPWGATNQTLHGGATTITYWQTSALNTYPMNLRRLNSGFPPPNPTSGCSVGSTRAQCKWDYAYVYGSAQTLEVDIPPDAPLGTFNMGLTLCTDTTYSVCYDVLWPITIVDVPQYTLQAPTNVPAMPSYFVGAPGAGPGHYCTTAKVGNTPYDTTTDCSFPTILYSGVQRSWEYMYPTTPNNIRTAVTPNTPDWRFENAATPVFACYSSACSQFGDYFYEGAFHMHQVAEVTGDKSWDNAARAVLARYTGIGPGPLGQRGCPSYWPYSAGSNTNNCTAYLPLNSTNIWNSNPEGIGAALGMFNGGVYRDEPAPPAAPWPKQYSSQMDSYLKVMWKWGGVAPQEGDPNNYGIGCNGNSYSPWPGTAGLTQSYDVRCGIAGQGGPQIGGGNGGRGFAYEVDVLAELMRQFGQDGKYMPAADGSQSYVTKRWRDNSDTSACASFDTPPCLTRFGWSYKAGIEALRSAALAMKNPALTGTPSDGANPGPFQLQYFMASLMAEALIRDWELTHDAIDLWCIKTILDTITPIYNGTDYQTTHLMTYCNVSDPYATQAYTYFCAGTARYTPGVGWYGQAGSHVNAVGYYDLNAYFATIYAWWWAHFSGSDNTYANMADNLMMDGFVPDYRAGWRGTGKLINEEMQKHIFNYFRWRQQRR